MKREYGLEAIEHDPRSVVTVGTFDGVHVGHQAIMRYLQERAEARDGVSVVVSFDPHPRSVITGAPVPLLSTIDERAEALAALGLDRFIVIPFTEAFRQIEAEAYVREILVERIGLREIVIGYDHAFGRGRRGDRALLEQMGAEHGFTVDVLPAQVVDEHVVSSSAIRRLLLDEGDVSEAAAMLGRPCAITGRVIEGDRRGRSIGFPTANLRAVHPDKIVPADGVYAVRATISGEAASFDGMMNIGIRPTFDGARRQLEVHLFDFDRMIYGAELQVEFVRRIRDERRFSSVEALKQQLSADRRRCMQLLRALP